MVRLTVSCLDVSDGQLRRSVRSLLPKVRVVSRSGTAPQAM